MTNTNKYIKLASILGALGVILGAFGAHAIKTRIADNSYDAYQTGVLYHFMHTLAIFGLGILYKHSPARYIVRSIQFFLVGIILFSGSLYLLATKDLIGANLSFLGPITPIGGLFFILGWANLFSQKE